MKPLEVHFVCASVLRQVESAKEIVKAMEKGGVFVTKEDRILAKTLTAAAIVLRKQTRSDTAGMTDTLRPLLEKVWGESSGGAMLETMEKEWEVSRTASLYFPGTRTQTIFFDDAGNAASDNGRDVSCLSTTHCVRSNLLDRSTLSQGSCLEYVFSSSSCVWPSLTPLSRPRLERCATTMRLMTKPQARACTLCTRETILPEQASSAVQQQLLQARGRCDVCGGQWVRI